MAKISLNPVANPVDTFAPAEIRGKSSGNALMQMARSLSALEPKLERIAGQYDEAERNRQLAEAVKFQQERQLRNMDEFKSAVDRGEIDEAENPWMMVAVKQLVAKRQLRSHAAQVESELLSDPAYRETDDFDSLQTELQSRIASPFADIDAFTLRSVTPDIERFVDGYMTRHKSRRLTEREYEAQDAFVSQLRQEFSGPAAALQALPAALDGDGDPEVQALARGTVGRVQSFLDGYGRVASTPKVRSVALASIEDAAVNAKSPELAKVLLNRLTVGGESLIDSVGSDYMTDLNEKITRAELDDYRLERAREQAADDIQLREALDVFDRAFAESGNSNPFSVEIARGDLSPAAWQKVLDHQQTLAQRSAEERYTKASSDLLAGRFDKADRASFLQAMYALGYPGFEGVRRFQAVENMLQGDAWGTLSPLAFAELESLYHTPGTTRDQKLDFLMQLAERQEIDQPTFKQYLSAAWSSETASGNTREVMIRAGIERFGQLVHAGLRRDESNFTRDPDRGMILDPDLQAQVHIESGRLASELRKYLDANPNADGDTIDSYINELVDTRSKSLGGFTYSQFDSQIGVISVRNELMDQTVVTDFRGKMKWSDGQLMVVSPDGATGPYPGTPRLFASEEDLRLRGRDVFETLGLASYSDLVSLYRQQLNTLRPADAPLRKAILKELEILQQYSARAQTKPQESE